MQYRELGSTNVLVSRLCLGTGNFGYNESWSGDLAATDEKEAFRIMDAALDLGITFFDTANVYGNHGRGTSGDTERIIGRWFAQGGGRREKIFLSTKVGRTMFDNDYDGPNTRDGLSLWKIRRHVEASLRRLGTDHVELLHMHRIDRNAQWDQIWEAFEGFVRAGKVDYIGSSQSYAWELMKAQEVARRRNFMGLVSTQHRYDMLTRAAELEAFPCALDQGIGVLLFSPLRRGVFAVDLLEPESNRPINESDAWYVETYRTQLTEYAKLCHDLGYKPAVVHTAWQLTQQAITAPIIGPATVQDLEELAQSVDVELTPDALAEIDRIFPPPTGHFYDVEPQSIRPLSWQ
jgi:aryl-alcohol dehydrogenase-like predicted oxidoreductase